MVAGGNSSAASPPSAFSSPESRLPSGLNCSRCCWGDLGLDGRPCEAFLMDVCYLASERCFGAASWQVLEVLGGALASAIIHQALRRDSAGLQPFFVANGARTTVTFTLEALLDFKHSLIEHRELQSEAQSVGTRKRPNYDNSKRTLYAKGHQTRILVCTSPHE